MTASNVALACVETDGTSCKPISVARILSSAPAVDAAMAADNATKTESLLMSAPFQLREILMARLVAARFLPRMLRSKAADETLLVCWASCDDETQVCFRNR